MFAKSQSAIIAVLLIVLTGFCGFLGWQVLELRESHEKLLTQTRDHTLDGSKVNEAIEALQSADNALSENLKSLVAKIDAVPASLRDEIVKQYVPLPRYAIDEPLFVLEESNDLIKVNGDLKSIDAWMDRNKLFIDFILQESLVMDIDPKTQKVLVTSIAETSFFHQMGFRQGDLILNIDGAAVYSGDDLRVRILELTAVKIQIQRAERKLTLEIAFK